MTNKEFKVIWELIDFVKKCEWAAKRRPKTIFNDGYLSAIEQVQEEIKRLLEEEMECKSSEEK